MKGGRGAVPLTRRNPADQRRGGPMALPSAERLVDDLHDEIVVAPAERPSHPGQTGVVGEIGAGVHLEHVGLAVCR